VLWEVQDDIRSLQFPKESWAQLQGGDRAGRENDYQDCLSRLRSDLLYVKDAYKRIGAWNLEDKDLTTPALRERFGNFDKL
jgi:hypothetical protein